jgi:hypothetical protein
MMYRVDVDPATGWAWVDIEGEIRLRDFIDALASVWEQPEYSGSRYTAWDFTNAHTTFYFDDVVDLSRYIAEHKNGRGPTTVAIVAPKDLEFGMGRVFAAFDEAGGYTVNVVRTRDAAAEWLQAQQAGASA